MTQLIWVEILTFRYIVVILTTPILLIKNSQNETTNSNRRNTDSCPDEFTGYCIDSETLPTHTRAPHSQNNLRSPPPPKDYHNSKPNISFPLNFLFNP